MDFRARNYIKSPAKLLECYKTMKRAPHLPQDQMEKWVVKQLRELCIYAKNHTTFYKERFEKADFQPEKMDSLEYYRRLPVLDKATVRAHQKEMMSDEADKLGACFCETSGSTGTPLQFYLDMNLNAATFSLFYRAWSMVPEWNIFKKQAALTGYEDGLYKYNPINHILYLSSFHMNDESVRTFYDLIKKYHVKFLRGYPSALYLFAKLLEKNHLPLQFSVVISQSETLLGYQREFIEQFFGAKVIDHYTHWEGTASICECMEGRLHAQNDYGYHEILNDRGEPISSGVGHLVCSGLYNKAMPLLRYDTRDLAEWSEESSCPCGSKFPIMKRIIGRIEDIVITPEGNYVGRLDAAFKYNHYIRFAYIRQKIVEEIHVNLCVEDGYDPKVEQPLLEKELRKRLGEKIRILYHIVPEEEIPHTQAGKVRFVISDVAHEYQLNKQYQ